MVLGFNAESIAEVEDTIAIAEMEIDAA